MASKKEEIIQRATAEQQQKFSLASFKKKKGFVSTVKFKNQEWIPLSKSWQDVTSLPGIPTGHITILRGHTDTGKTTTLLECAASCQRKGILPVFIITEMKFNWEYARSMGVEYKEVCDPETGEVVDYDGFFIYIDRTALNTIEDVANFIANLLDDQAKGKLPYDLCFLWDSVGSIPCEQSIASNKNNAQWNAGALSTQFGNYLDQKIVLSRKEGQPYTNTMVVVNKIWVKPPETFMASPKVMNKGGEAIAYDASVIITFGNIADSGVTKLKAVAGKKEFEWGKRTTISIDKNHIGNVTSKGKIIMTPTGFIDADDKVIEKYKVAHKDEWAEKVGSKDFKLVEEEVPLEDEVDYEK